MQLNGAPAVMTWADIDEAEQAAADIQENVGIRRGTAVDWCYSSLYDDRNPVAVRPAPASLPEWTTTDTGCATLSPLVLTQSTGPGPNGCKTDNTVTLWYSVI